MRPRSALLVIEPAFVSKRHTQDLVRTMERSSHHASPQLRVTALFGDHEQSIDLDRGTTLGHLAELLAELARQNRSWPVGISVVLKNAPTAANDDISIQWSAAAQVGKVR